MSRTFLKARGSQILDFQCDRGTCIIEFNACHYKSIPSLFIDDGVGVCVGPWRGFKFSVS